MDLIDELQEEHREALRRLDVLESALGAMEAGHGEIPPVSVERFAAAWIWFQVDLNIHFRKEEEALFPAAADARISVEGPVEQMRAEHREFEELREQVVGALETIRHGCCGKREAGERLLRAGAQLSALLREHIWKEDNVLFPMLRAEMGADLLARAARVAARILPPRVAVGS